MLIRRAKAEDITDFVEIYEKAYRGLEKYAYTTRREIKSYFKWLRRRDPDGMFVAVVGKPIGFIACDTNWYSSFEGKEVGEIHELFVSPEWQKKGVGGALLSRGLDYARERGRDIAELWVGRGNLRARRFYEKWGFKLAEGWGHWVRMIKKL
ncbi:MAG: N-acetyltransferase [Archaeoglobales archaeon]|nr:MAG: N-acetyltransferase [Archaeoglobales archaeon]